MVKLSDPDVGQEAGIAAIALSARRSSQDPMTSLGRRLKKRLRMNDSRMMRVMAVAGATYLGRFGQGLVVLITLPMARQALSPELFGVWMMLSALLGFMAFTDLGIGNSVLNKVTQAQATNDPAGLRRTLASGYAVTSAIGVVCLLSWLVWSQVSLEPTALAGDITRAHRAEVMSALTVFAVVLAVNVPSSLIQRVQLGMQQGYWVGTTQFAAALISLAAVPLVLRNGGGVAALVASTLGVQACANVVNTLVWLRANDMLRLSDWTGSLDASTMRALLRTGGMFCLLQLAAAFTFQSDAIVITHALGPAAYGDFAVVQRVFLFVSMVMSAAMVGLWPAFGDALARGEIAWVRRVLLRSLGSTLVVMGSLCVLLTLSMDWVMKLWLGAPHPVALGLTALLASWALVESLGLIVASLLNGANMIRAQVLMALAMASAAFCGKWLLVRWIGVEGPVLATLIAYCCIAIPGQTLLVRSLFRRAGRLPASAPNLVRDEPKPNTPP